MESCIFCKIARHDIPKDFVYEDNTVMVFDDLHKLRPIHFLIVPKSHITDFAALSDRDLWDKMREVAQKVAKEQLAGKGYRMTINAGGAQIIDHLHMHMMGPVGKTDK